MGGKFDVLDIKDEQRSSEPACKEGDELDWFREWAEVWLFQEDSSVVGLRLLVPGPAIWVAVLCPVQRNTEAAVPAHSTLDLALLLESAMPWYWILPCVTSFSSMENSAMINSYKSLGKQTFLQTSVSVLMGVASAVDTNINRSIRKWFKYHLTKKKIICYCSLHGKWEVFKLFLSGYFASEEGKWLQKMVLFALPVMLHPSSTHIYSTAFMGVGEYILGFYDS